jgi:coproporphyrinogen III oxidase
VFEKAGVHISIVHAFDHGTTLGSNFLGSRVTGNLVTLPFTTHWMYRYEPEPGSPEEKLIDVSSNPRQWLKYFRVVSVTIPIYLGLEL